MDDRFIINFFIKWWNYIFVFSFAFILFFSGQLSVLAKPSANQKPFADVSGSVDVRFDSSNGIITNHYTNIKGSNVILVGFEGKCLYTFDYAACVFCSKSPFTLSYDGSNAPVSYDSSTGIYYRIDSWRPDVKSVLDIPVTNVDAMSIDFNDFKNYLVSLCNGDWSGFSYGDPDTKDMVYDSEIGALTNLKYDAMTNGENINTSDFQYWYKISYNWNTDKKFDIRKHDCFIQYGFYCTGELIQFFGFSKKEIDPFISDFYTRDNTENYVRVTTSEIDELKKQFIESNGYEVPKQGSLRMFGMDMAVNLRVVEVRDGEYYYGDWVKVYQDKDGKTVFSKGITDDGSIKENFDKVNDSGKVDTAYGDGDTIDEAESNAVVNRQEKEEYDKKHANDRSFKDSLDEMVAMIEVIPDLISILFSYLPSWCLVIMGIAFSLLAILIVKRAVF